MPNLCFNILNVQYERELTENELKIVKEQLFPEEKVDFNVFIPMPKHMILCGLNDEIKTKKQMWFHKYKDIASEEQIQETLRNSHYIINENNIWKKVDKFEETVENYESTQLNNWYDWSCKNWGTKWNAMRSDIKVMDKNQTCFRFDTAWGIDIDNLPLQIYKKILELNLPIKSLEFEAEGEFDSFLIKANLSHSYSDNNIHIKNIMSSGNTLQVKCNKCGEIFDMKSFEKKYDNSDYTEYCNNCNEKLDNFEQVDFVEGDSCTVVMDIKK